MAINGRMANPPNGAVVTLMVAIIKLPPNTTRAIRFMIELVIVLSLLVKLKQITTALLSLIKPEHDDGKIMGILREAYRFCLLIGQAC
ncbi:MAG: hypothetical protein AMJ55_13230 [Gammaproteobacteria bacterium SG8_15]|nr:MAG: hypothetical protein AMJ55_13230 [Gammaproteobacteria bacterium SG8_15]